MCAIMDPETYNSIDWKSVFFCWMLERLLIPRGKTHPRPSPRVGGEKIKVIEVGDTPKPPALGFAPCTPFCGCTGRRGEISCKSSWGHPKPPDKGIPCQSLVRGSDGNISN